jgi:bis(5'-nucleosidyl)-tetraphosphatase
MVRLRFRTHPVPYPDIHMYEDDPVRAAGLLLRREASGKRSWLLLRNRKRGEWGFPKGHADAGEDDVSAALRECAEECGIGLAALDGTPRTLVYRLASGTPKQVIYFPARTAQDRVILSHEHDRAGWFDARGVIERMPYNSICALFRAHLRDFRYH